MRAFSGGVLSLNAVQWALDGHLALTNIALGSRSLLQTWSVKFLSTLPAAP